MKIGLFFGSFNPIHIGHVAIAKYMAEKTDLYRVWMVVSPRNPLKEKKYLADAKKRLVQVKKAIGKNPKIKVSDVEFKLPQPSYTIYTLRFLTEKFPRHEFVIIMGSDNLALFHKWKSYKKILENYQIYVYPRSSPLKRGAGPKDSLERGFFKNHRNIKMADAPKIDISSTFIREQMRKGRDVKDFVM